MRRFVSILALCLLAALAVGPSQPVDAQTGHQDVRLVIETPTYELDAAGLRVPGYATSETPGAPRLPVWTTTVDIPEGADWSIVEVGSEEHVIPAPATLPAAPVTTLRLDGPISNYGQDAITDALVTEDRPDPAIYGVDALYPGQVVQAGPEGAVRGKRLLPLRVFPFQYNPRTGLLRYRPTIQVTVHFEPRQRGHEAAVAAPAREQDAALPGLRIRTSERGMHRLTYAALSAAGAPIASVVPAQLAMTYLGQPIDIEVSGAEDGTFDPNDEIVFYAEPYVGRYMTQNVYRLTWGGASAGRMATGNAVPTGAEPPLDTMRRRARVEADRVYYSTYSDLARDTDHFFDNPLYVLKGSTQAVTTTYTLPLENVVTAGNASLRIAVHGGLSVTDRNPDQSLAIRYNDIPLGPYTWDGAVTHLIEQEVLAANLVSGANKVALVASLGQLPGIDKYWVLPDWVEIVYPAQTLAQNNRLFIEAAIGQTTDNVRDVAALGFTASGVKAYDVSDPRRPVRLAGIKETGNNGAYSVVFAGKPNASFYLTSGDGLKTPVSVEFDKGSTLASSNNRADYIAIVHRSLWDAIQPLLDHRARQGLRVAKVDVQDVYDEFSGGRVDPEAIRAFLAQAYQQWNSNGPRPQYVLLVGDGHFDFKGVLRPDLPNLIPPYLLDVDPFIGETAVDNRYASVDNDADFLPDMAIGRLPAKSASEVSAVVGKILAYETNAEPGGWQKRLVFVADNKNDAAGNFHGMSDAARTHLPRLYEDQAIYYKSSSALDTAAEMKAAIQAAFDGGALYVQWFGHAARTFWGKDKIWELSDPARLVQNRVWPFTASFSCWAGYFINVQDSPQYGDSERVLAETMLLASGKSSLADFSPSGLHVGSDLITLSTGLTEALFTRRIDRVGLAVDAAKLRYFEQGGGALDVIDTQVLFGDPATQLKLPTVGVYLPLLHK